jgi:hypothetical protein
MAESKFGIHIFSLSEANILLPRIRHDLSSLRELRKKIVARQARVDIEEMAGEKDGSGQELIEQLLREIERDVHAFHKATEALHALGCELKDLDKGLIDFYGMRGNDVVYFCWMDGEEEVSHWHPLDSGFKGRKKLED